MPVNHGFPGLVGLLNTKSDNSYFIYEIRERDEDFIRDRNGDRIEVRNPV